MKSPFSADLDRKKSLPAEPSSSADYNVTGGATVALAAEATPHSAVGNETELAAQVTAAAEASGFNDLAHMLRNGEWRFSAAEILVQTSDPPELVRIAFNKQAEQVLNQAASTLLNRTIKLKIARKANGGASPPAPPPPSRVASSRVADEPVIRQLQEKFGAEIRSVIDYREKG